MSEVIENGVDKGSESEIIEDDVAQRRKAHRQRIGLVVSTGLVIVLYSGAIFGWGPFQLMLEENGSFSSKCSPEEYENEEDNVCPDQTAALVNVPFFAIMTQVTAPVLGQIADHYGPRVLGYFMAASACLGLALLIVAVEFVDELLYPSFMLLAMSTWSSSILQTFAGMQFLGRAQSRVIFVLNGLFDSGSVTYLGLWGIYSATGASLTAISTGYFVGALLFFGATSYFWTVVTPEQDYSMGISSKESEVMELPSSEAERDEQCTGERTTKDGNVIAVEVAKSGDEPPENNTEEITLSQSMENEIRQETMLPMDEDKSIAYVIVADRTERQQLTSWAFCLVIAFFTIHVTYVGFVDATMRDFLASLGDDDYDNLYLKIFQISTPVSLIGVPFVDAMITRYGFHGGFQAVNMLSFAANLIRVLSDDLNVMILSFIFLSFFRCFLFAVTFSYLPTVLSGGVVGKANGLLLFVTGIFSFVNIPLASFAIKTQEGDFFIPNLIYTFMVIPAVYVAYSIGRTIQVEKAAKEGTLVSQHDQLRMSLGGIVLRKHSTRAQ